MSIKKIICIFAVIILVTTRNGNQNDPKYKKVYAEKYIKLNDGQHFPYHFHRSKSEDIINRGGGTMVITVYNDDGNGDFSQKPVTVNQDGRSYEVPAGTEVLLKPGESITLWPYQYHCFNVLPGSGDVLIS